MDASILAAGGGGLNGEVVEALVKKGYGEIHVCDHDTVSRTNLNRQKFTERDLYKNKAERLCRNMRNQGFNGSRLLAYPCSFQELDVSAISPTVIVCGVDNQIEGTRAEVSIAAKERGVPCIIYAVSTDASYGYVFVQEIEGACWGCVFKPELSLVESAVKRCAPTPACCDILKALSGHVLYAIDSLVMSRKRDWNYRVISLDKSEFGCSRMISPREECAACRAMREKGLAG